MSIFKYLAILFLFFISPALAQKKITLRLVDWAGTDEITIDKKTVEAFKERYPNIDVLYEPNPGHQYEEKLLTALAADAPPDVFLLDSKLIPTFTNKNILLDLKPYISKLNIDTTQWFENVFAIARRGSAIYAFPKGFTPLVIYFNKRLFDNANIPYPSSTWDWNDFLNISLKLTKDFNGDDIPEQYGTAFTNYYFYWIPWVWSAGGDVLNKNGYYSTNYLNTSETESAIEFLINLRNKFKVAPDVGTWVQAEKTGTSTSLFANGQIAMILDGHWRMPKFIKYHQEGSLDIGVAPLPRHPSGGKVNVMYESGWCVPISTRHPEEAVLLAEFMAGEVACRIRSVSHLEIPANIKVAYEAVANDTSGMEKVFLDEVQYCRQPWGSIVERFSEIEWTLQDAVDEVMLNNKPLHQTMTEYAKRVDKQLENIRAHEKYSFKPIKTHSEIFQFLIGVSICSILGASLLYLNAKRKERKLIVTAFTFLSPSLFHLIIFVFTPIVFSAYLSFHQWDIVVPDKQFIGFNNFTEMFSDENFWNALRNTFIYSLNVPIGMGFSLAIALIMHKKLKGIGFMRTLFFLPSVTSLVAVALVWMWIYHPSFGAANFVLNALGLPSLQWLNSSQTAMISVMLFTIWLGLGYQMIIFLAGLQGIPAELYEAAIIDGAGGWKIFWRITFPLLKPTTFFILVTSFIGSFQVFTSIYVMTAGGPVRSTDVIVYHIYQSAWEQLRMGYAAAMSWVLFVIIMAATWLQFKFLGKEVHYG